ncbi:MAG: hypothetical protein ACK55I_27630, partial [bacterium]
MDDAPDDRFTLARARDWLSGFHDRILARETLLTDLDAAIGDADHGTNMTRGVRAAIGQPEVSAAASLEA